MEIYFTSSLVPILIILAYFLRKQILLNEKFLEDKLHSTEIIDNLDDIIYEIGIKLDEIDTKGSFKSDDEIGFFFTEVQNMYQMLVDYKKL